MSLHVLISLSVLIFLIVHVEKDRSAVAGYSDIRDQHCFQRYIKFLHRYH